MQYNYCCDYFSDSNTRFVDIKPLLLMFLPQCRGLHHAEIKYYYMPLEFT